jgi:CheY-like chemotaxis protein
MADSGQIEQIIMNLATNSRDAMPHGGTLTIVCGLEEIDQAFCNAHGCGRPGQYAIINVSDTGIGMSENTKKKIFDHFFTTKEFGKGTGLGLSMVYGIVHQHKGFLVVESGPGKGTTFRVYLPANKTDEIGKTQSIQPQPVAGRIETILVAEDDQTLRELSQIVLESYGYKVILAVDGLDAVAKFTERKETVGLVILDMIMPKMSGPEVYKAIKKMRPEIKALFLSGYTADKIRAEGLLPADVELASKPISQHDLLTTVRNILGHRRT